MKIFILFAATCLTLVSCNQQNRQTRASGQCDDSQQSDCCGQNCGCGSCNGSK